MFLIFAQTWLNFVQNWKLFVRVGLHKRGDGSRRRNLNDPLSDSLSDSMSNSLSDSMSDHNPAACPAGVDNVASVDGLNAVLLQDP